MMIHNPSLSSFSNDPKNFRIRKYRNDILCLVGVILGISVGIHCNASEQREGKYESSDCSTGGSKTKETGFWQKGKKVTEGIS
jgi:hypothetical protein